MNKPLGSIDSKSFTNSKNDNKLLNKKIKNNTIKNHLIKIIKKRKMFQNTLLEDGVKRSILDLLKGVFIIKTIGIK